MTPLEKHKWEATHLAIIAADILALALITHLLSAPLFSSRHRPNFPAVPQTPASVSATDGIQPIPFRPVATDHYQPTPAASRPSDPNEITVGPSGINNRYKLTSVARRKDSPQGDKLVLTLHVESLATDPMVSPFESDMLEIHIPGQPPIKPNTPFRSPIPAGNTRNQDIAFSIPSSLSLDRATLQIHYYNYQDELPLRPSVPGAPH